MKTNFISVKGNFRTVFSLHILFVLILSFSFISCSKNKIDLGKSYVKEPSPDKIVKTESGEMPVNQFAVIMKADFDKKDAEKIAQEYGGSVVGEIEFLNLYQIETVFSKEEELKKALGEVSKKVEIESAFGNGAVYLREGESISCDPLDDPVYKTPGASVAFDMINLKDAWKYIKASGIELSDVNVGVNDDAIGSYTGELYIRGNDYINKKVDERINKGWSFKSDVTVTTDQSKPEGGEMHSNDVINIIAANNNNGGISGIASVLKNKLKIKHIDTFGGTYTDPETKTDTADITQFKKNGKSYICTMLKDLKRQVENGSQVINCSFGTTNPNDKEVIGAFKKFLKNMAEKHRDVIFVGAAGDSDLELNGENDGWGSNTPNLVTVGRINENGEKGTYTNYAGQNGEITVSVCGKINQHDGATSFCAPQVTGVIALMKSLNPKLSAAQIKDILVMTASKNVNGKQVDPRMGGCLNAADAIFSVIKAIKKDESLTKEFLLNLANLELTTKGGPREFTVTAFVRAVSEKGTKLSIDISGSNFILNGNKEQKLNAAGSVSWDISLGEESKGVTVTVKRLDTDGCAIVFLSSMPAVLLLGKVTGFLDPGDGDKTGKYIFNVIEGDAKLNIDGSGDAVLTFNYKTQTVNRSPSPDPKWAILDYFTGAGTLTGNIDFYKGTGFELKGSVNGTTHNVETHGVPNKLGDRTVSFPNSAKFSFKEINKDSKKVVLRCEIIHPGRQRGDYRIYCDLEGNCDVSLILKQ